MPQEAKSYKGVLIFISVTFLKFCHAKDRLTHFQLICPPLRPAIASVTVPLSLDIPDSVHINSEEQVTFGCFFCVRLALCG